MAIVTLRPYQNLTTIVFIDGSLSDLQTILSGLDPSVTAIVLDPAQDGIQQMADALAGMSGLEAIHIISHGSSGQINLGTTQLSQDTLAQYQTQLATVGNALSDTGDLMLYGCNVAQGIQGQAFISSLATATSAGVAASTDLTGAVFLGGDANLEANVGDISTQPLITQSAFDDLGMLLDTGTKTGANSTNFTYTTANTWVYTPIAISGAPNNATITSVTVTWNVDSNYTTDIDWYVENWDGYWASSSYVMAKTGNDLFPLDSYSETSDGSMTLYPTSSTPVNGTWYFNIADVVPYPGTVYDQGRIDFWSISISYSFTPPQPDLIVSSVTGTAASYNVGNTISATATIKNQDLGTASGSNLSYYLGAPDGTNLRYIEDGSVGSLAYNATANDAVNWPYWTIPADVVEGSYRIWVKADSGGTENESNEGNNWGSSSIFYIYAPKPDLDITDIAVSGSLTQGQTVTLAATFSTSTPPSLIWTLPI